MSRERQGRRPYEALKNFGLSLGGDVEPWNGFSLGTDMVKLVFYKLTPALVWSGDQDWRRGPGHVGDGETQKWVSGDGWREAV